MKTLKKGMVIKNFILENKIKSLNEFWEIINSDVSIFARDKVSSSAFFFSWQIRLIQDWIERGWFWTIKRKDNGK